MITEEFLLRATLRLPNVHTTSRRYATGRSVCLSLSFSLRHFWKWKFTRGLSTRNVRVWNFFLGAPVGPPRPNVRRIVSISWRVERRGKKLALAANARLKNIDWRACDICWCGPLGVFQVSSFACFFLARGFSFFFPTLSSWSTSKADSSWFK